LCKGSIRRRSTLITRSRMRSCVLDAL
jgi:hypothetical protein